MPASTVRGRSSLYIYLAPDWKRQLLCQDGNSTLRLEFQLSRILALTDDGSLFTRILHLRKIAACHKTSHCEHTMTRLSVFAHKSLLRFYLDKVWFGLKILNLRVFFSKYYECDGTFHDCQLWLCSVAGDNDILFLLHIFWIQQPSLSLFLLPHFLTKERKRSSSSSAMLLWTVLGGHARQLIWCCPKRWWDVIPLELSCSQFNAKHFEL